MEFRQRRSDAPEVFEAKLTIRFAINRLSKPPEPNLLAIIHTNGNCVAHYLRRLHNFALDLGWLPVARPRKTSMAENPKPKQKSDHCRRTWSSHRFWRKTPNVARTMNCSMKPVPPKPTLQICTAEDIDWQNGVLIYRRKKLGPFSEPCRLTIGKKTPRCCSTSLPSIGRFVSKHQANLSKPPIRRISQTLQRC